MSLETIDMDRLNIRPGDRLLDLGCGEGRHSISAYLQSDASILGLDLGLQDLRTARSRLRNFQSPLKKPAPATLFEAQATHCHSRTTLLIM